MPLDSESDSNVRHTLPGLIRLRHRLSADASGDATATSTGHFSGFIVGFVVDTTTPGDPPAANWDLILTDDIGILDGTDGNGTNLTGADQAFDYANTPIPFSGQLTVTGDEMGANNDADVYIYFLRAP